jgi:uncharacterized membrane protein
MTKWHYRSFFLLCVLLLIVTLACAAGAMHILEQQGAAEAARLQATRILLGVGIIAIIGAWCAGVTAESRREEYERTYPSKLQRKPFPLSLR